MMKKTKKGVPFYETLCSNFTDMTNSVSLN